MPSTFLNIFSFPSATWKLLAALRSAPHVGSKFTVTLFISFTHNKIKDWRDSLVYRVFMRRNTLMLLRPMLLTG